MQRHIIFCFLLLFLGVSNLPAFGQSKVDSLMSVLTAYKTKVPNYERDTTYIKTYLELGRAYIKNRQYAEAEPVVFKGFSLVQQTYFINGLIEAYCLLSMVHTSLNKPDIVIQYTQKGIAITQESKYVGVRKEFMYYEAQAHQVKGDIKTMLKKALALKALQEQTPEENKRFAPYIYQSVAQAYAQIDASKSLEAYEQMLLHLNNDKLHPLYISAVNGIGNILLQRKEFEKALKHQKYHINILLSIDPNTIFLGSSYTILAFTFKELQQGDSATVYFKKSIAIYKKVNNRINLLYSMNGLARLLMERGKLEEAETLANEAYQIGVKNRYRLHNHVNSGLLYEIYKAKNEYEKALHYYEIYKNINDTINNEINNKEIGRIEAKYEIAQKEREFQQKERIQSLENEQLEQDILLQTSEKERQTLFATQAEQRSLLLVSEKDRQALEIAKQKKEKEQQTRLFEAERKQKQSEAQQQKLYAYLLAGSLLFALVVLFLIGRNNRQKQQTNLLLRNKNEEITTQSEHLAEANRIKDSLFAIIAHDLRSPIMAFQGLNKQIKFFMQKNRPEKLEQLGENIEKASASLNSLLDNLLQWAMLQKQVIQVNRQTIDLQEAITHCLSHFEGLAQSQEVTLHHGVGKERIQTDYNIIQTILRNLISNALKFTPEGGNVYLAYQREGRQGILSVRDTGAGMSAEKIRTLFGGGQFQSERGLRGEKGTGIGLQLCYELAQKIEATLTVESQEGQGTVFALVLHNVEAFE